MSLSLTPMSEQRALRFLSAAKNTGRPVKKVSGAGLSRLLAASPEVCERLYVINRSMFGQEFGLGPDDEASFASLKARGVTRVLLRVNADRDLITVTL